MTKHDAERKRKILDYIAATLRTRGYPPSVREIAVATPCGPRGELNDGVLCACELLGLKDLRGLELGPAARGSGRAALASYSEGIAAVLQNLSSALRPGAPVVIVVNDRRDLYPEILAAVGLKLEDCHRRHVNRRTGRRAGEYYEDVLVTRFA